MSIEMRDNDSEYLRGPRLRTRSDGAQMRLVDLFSGCGGLSLGVEEAARLLGLHVDVRLAVERDPLAAATYIKNFSVEPERRFADVVECFDRSPGSARSTRERDIAALVGPHLDLLVGGPPCQGHSSLNNHTRGVDPKNELYLSMVRAAEVLRPRFLIIENVPAVERDSRRVVERAETRLRKVGYQVSTGVVPIAALGVPQLRRRHVLVASITSLSSIDELVREAATPARDLRWAISDLQTASGSLLDGTTQLSAENRKRAEHLLRRDLYELPNSMRPRCQRDDHRYKSMYGRLRWDAPAQTITTGFGSPGQGRYLHPDEPRTLTPHEAARIQFFPDWFDFSPLATRRALARAIGNAVPSKLSFVLAHSLLRATQGKTSAHRKPRSKPTQEAPYRWL